MEKLHLTRKMGMVLLAMVMLWPMACKRDQLPPGNSLLNTYRGTDKMVLKVIEVLKEPANQTVLADLEKQGNMNWKYETLITSRFLKGHTLRFATDSDGNYLDAEVNAETGDIKLFSKQMQQQRDALSKQAFNSQALKQGSGTLNSVCNFGLFFELKTSWGSGLLANLTFLNQFMKLLHLTSDSYSGSDFSSYLSFKVGGDFLTTAMVKSAALVAARDYGFEIVSLSVTNSCENGTSTDTVMHRLPANRLPANNNSDLQTGAMCVFKTMEWIAKYYGRSLSVSTSSFYYFQNLSGLPLTLGSYMSLINQNGVRGDRIAPLLGHYFSYSPSGDVKTGLMNGFPVFCAVKVSGDGSVYHAVMATGYANDGTIEYYDPQTGTYRRVMQASFSYIFTITGG